MNHEKTKRQIELILIVVIMVSIIGITYYISANDIFNNKLHLKSKEFVHHVSISIESPNLNISYETENTTNITVASLLFECTQYHNLSVKKQFWSGYDSFFITSIADLSNGRDNSYWQYYVNDEYPDMGCSLYVLNDYDHVIWIFEQSPW